jgi:NAD(P)-dependent dehydrogenase (short-subunit alcohol dehydrogenase family)
MKKIIVVGATGTIGRAVVERLQDGNEIVKVANANGDFTVDMTNAASIQALFEKVGEFNALVVAAGDIAFADFSEMTDEQWQVGINSKLMGQVNLTRKALPFLKDGGSVTLVSGILTEEPIAWGTSASTINGAVNHFVQAAATELPRGIRINAVSPTVVTESLHMYGDFFPGFESVSSTKVSNAFYKSVMGVHTGTVFEVFE